MSRPSVLHAPPSLALRGVAVRRGERRLLEDLDLWLAPGGAAWLRGGNGRGKTSVLRLAAGLALPEAGVVERADVAPPLYVGHATALNADLSAREALDFLARLHGAAPAPDALSAALDALGLPRRLHGTPVRRLSQGQRRRVALARLALDPPRPLWLLDEPFDALDAEGAARVEALVAAHRARGGALLFTSHRAPGDAMGPVDVLDLDARPVPAPAA